MNAEDLEQIGRHEAAHLARRDDCSLFVQRVIEALFALHPVVRWLTRQIDLEREIACDDIAVGSTERAWSYADCLTRTVALCGGVRTSLAAANVADGRSHLSRRVELLVDRSRSGRTEILRGRCAVIAVALVCLAGLLAKAPLLLAFAVPPTGNPTPAPAQIDVPLQPPPARPLLAQASGANGAGVANEAGAKSFAGQLVRGNEQMKARQFDDAIATYQGIMSDAPDDRTKSDLWSRIGEAYRYKGDFAHGIQAMERADTLLPDNTAIATNLGLLYESQQDFAHARQYYEHALAINPNNPLVLNNLAYLLTQTGGDLDQALTYARTAQAKLPSFLEVDDTIGWIYLKKDMSSIAASEFWKATQAVPQNPEFHYHYALALYAEGNLFDALNECQTALANKPDKEMEGNIRSLIDKIAPESDVPFKRPQALRKPDQDQTK